MPVGGAERFMLSLSGALRAHTGKQTIVNLSRVDTLAREIADGVNYLPLPRQSRFDFKPVKALRRHVKTDQPDLIFCINFFSYLVIRCALFGMRKKPPIIISYHTTDHLTKKEYWLHHFYARMLQRTDLVVCVSNNQARRTRETFKMPERKIRTVLNSVNTDFWTPDEGDADRKKVRGQLNIPESAEVVVLSAAFRPEKNHLGALNALKIVHEKYNRKLYLLLVGDGVMREKIEQRIQENGLEDFVKMPGQQPDVKPYLRSADIFTLCSTSVETFSIAALEAMSCGLPLSLTDVGGASEMVDPAINGVVTGYSDEQLAKGWIETLDANFSREKIRGYAVERFGMDRMVNEYLQLMETIK